MGLASNTYIVAETIKAIDGKTRMHQDMLLVVLWLVVEITEQTGTFAELRDVSQAVSQAEVRFHRCSIGRLKEAARARTRKP
jgi:hypothetical protein